MNNIQKLIDDLKARKEKAQKECNEALEINEEISAAFQQGYADAFSFCVKKLTLLLNAEAETNGQEDTKNDGNAV